MSIAAQYLQNQNQANSGGAADVESSIVGALLGAAESAAPAAITNPPTLASLAFGVEMYWGGEVFRGYFTHFSVTESADKLGLFDYDMGFVVTQRRGLRLKLSPSS